ncbi:hypothetical protein FO599_35395, partial [Bacillus thuringiensis]|nr:hypothetical protein [Bacillus thuringiensis]
TRRCSERNCNNLHYAIGLCEKHYHQKRIYGQVVSEVEDNEPCEVKDCPFPRRAKGYCRKHYSQMYRNGEINTEVERDRVNLCIVDGCTGKHKSHGYCS